MALIFAHDSPSAEGCAEPHSIDRGTRTVWEIDETQIDLEEFLAS